jgi:hypothetical protein
MRFVRYWLLLIVCLMLPAYGQMSQDLVRFRPPVAPDSVTVGAPSYSGTTEYLRFSPLFSATSPAMSVQQYQWQYSTDSGTTWKGPDGTSSTYYFAPSYINSFTSGTMEVRCRSITPQYPSGVASAWVTSANTTYTSPSSGGGTVVPFTTWSSTTTYTTGQVVYGSDNNLYVSQGNSNLNNNPTLDTGTNWKLWGLEANLTMNCGVGQQFADTFAASSSPGGAMSPGMNTAITFSATAGVAVSPTVATATYQQANNPSTTCSATGSTTTLVTTLNIPLYAHILFKGDVTVGLKGYTGTVTASTYSAGNYTLTLGNMFSGSTVGSGNPGVVALPSAPVGGDTFWYTPFYGSNRILFNSLAIGQNAKVLGSTSNPVCPTALPSVTFSGTGGTGWAIGPPNYFAVSYTYVDNSGTTRETLPGSVVSQTASSGQQPTVASFTLPTGIAGAKLYASETLNGTLYYQATFTISGGVAQALSVPAYTTSSYAAATTMPDVATYPCAIGGNPLSNQGLINIQPYGQSYAANTVSYISGLTLYGLGSAGNSSACGVVMAFNCASKILNCVLAGWGTASGSVGGNAIITEYGKSAVYLQNDEISNSYTGFCMFSGSGLTRNIRIYNCDYGILCDSSGSSGDVEGANVWATYGFYSRYSSTLYTTPYQPTNGTAVPTYGCSTASSPGFNALGTGQQAGSINYND